LSKTGCLIGSSAWKQENYVVGGLTMKFTVDRLELIDSLEYLTTPMDERPIQSHILVKAKSGSLYLTTDPEILPSKEVEIEAEIVLEGLVWVPASFLWQSARRHKAARITCYINKIGHFEIPLDSTKRFTASDVRVVEL
jgi:hypothetical protein